MSKVPLGEIHADPDGTLTMSIETLRELVDFQEETDDAKILAESDETEADEEGILGRKNYCCHNTEDGRCVVIRASNGFSAAIKCVAHYGGRPVNSHRGDCRH